MAKNDSNQGQLASLTFIVLLIEAVILVMQTNLMCGQNKIMSDQTILIETQNNLFKSQNDLVEGQNGLMRKQNNLIDKQVEYEGIQNDLLIIQNERLTQQNQLADAQRRSSFVFMMGNIMDAINEKLNDPFNEDRLIPVELIGQVISLSNSLTPYKFIIDSSLISKPLSPERGMLLIYLLQSELNPDNLNEIIKKATFKSSYIENLNLTNKRLDYLDLSNSNIENIQFDYDTIEKITCNSCNIINLRVRNSVINSFNLINDYENIDLSVNKSRLFDHYIKTLNANNIKIDSSDIRDFMIEADSINNIVINYTSLEWIHVFSSNVNNIWLNKSVGNNITLKNSKDKILSKKLLLTIDDSLKYYSNINEFIISSSYFTYLNSHYKVSNLYLINAILCNSRGYFDTPIVFDLDTTNILTYYSKISVDTIRENRIVCPDERSTIDSLRRIRNRTVKLPNIMDTSQEGIVSKQRYINSIFTKKERIHRSQSKEN